jgi:hypothetical protein
VGCTAGSTFHRWVGAGVAGAASGDHTKVVLGIVLLCTDAASGFLCIAEFGMVAITIAVVALRCWGPRKVFSNVASLVSDEECVCTKVGQGEGTLQGDDDGRGLFVEPAFSGDEPTGLLHEFDGRVGKLDYFLDCGFGGTSGDVVD